jgi:hypothetical protein
MYLRLLSLVRPCFCLEDHRLKRGQIIESQGNERLLTHSTRKSYHSATASLPKDFYFQITFGSVASFKSNHLGHSFICPANIDQDL